MSKIGTATVDIVPEVNAEQLEAVGQQFARLRSISPVARPAREVALDLAINSLSVNETPPGHEAIVARAQAFLAFLDPDDPR